MTKKNKALVFFLAILPLAGTALALDGARLAASEQSYAPRRHAATESADSDSSMQATCREVLVDTDEGYGVTNRESRFVCDDNR